MIPRPSWFLRQPPGELHGLAHTARVMLWAAVIATPEWREAAVWAAACHDLRREDDGIDAEHGRRAAAWVRAELESCAVIPMPRGATADIAMACEWHATSDAEIPFAHPLLQALKDADGLDRVRLGDLDPRMLRLPGSATHIEDAWRLWERTRGVEDPLDVWRAAGALGLSTAVVAIANPGGLWTMPA